MTMLWLAAAALTSAVLAWVLRPLWRRRQPTVGQTVGSDLAVYRDQLAEVDRDVARGLMDAAEADTARNEIQRRMLAAARETPAPVVTLPPRRPVVASVLATAVAAAALATYGWLGRPDAPDRPLVAAGAPPGTGVATPEAPPEGLEQAVGRLKQRLAENPDHVDGWLLLGRSLMALSQPAEAADAFARALTLADRPDIHADRGEALVDAAAGRVTDTAGEAFLAAVDADPLQAKARYYLALQRAQQGDVAAALEGWVDLWALSPADAPWRPVLARQIVRAASDLGTDPASLRPSPSAVDLGATNTATPSLEVLVTALPSTERNNVLKTLAATLEARVTREPDDADGWLFLARVHALAGNDTGADAARTRATELERR